MSLLQDAIRLTANAGEDFWTSAMLIANRGGFVFITPECVLVAQRESEDTLFVWMLLGRGAFARLCAFAPPEIRWLKWQRGFRLAERAQVGVFDFARVRRLVALSSHHEPQTTQSNGSAGCQRAASGGDHVGAESVN